MYQQFLSRAKKESPDTLTAEITANGFENIVGAISEKYLTVLDLYTETKARLKDYVCH